jgi:hypothetical protein
VQRAQVEEGEEVFKHGCYETKAGTSRCGNYLPAIISFFVIVLCGGLILGIIFMYVLTFHYFIVLFLLDRRDWSLADGKHISCMCSWCWYVHFEAHFGKEL